jgi:uncharacterized protein (DUF952 family)
MQTKNSDLREYIVHLCTRQAWETAQTAGEYRAASIESEGFIHCSRPDQILEVANSFYRQIPDLVLLWIDPRLVIPEIRFEKPAQEAQDDYPHIYGSINLDAVISVSAFSTHPDGYFRTIPLPV